MTSPVASVLPIPAGVSLAPERAKLWQTTPQMWVPRQIEAAGAIALTAGRAHTAYRKIIDVFAPDTTSFRAVLIEVINDRGFVDATHPAPAVIRFEEHPAIAPLTSEHEATLADLGFTRDPAPVPSVPSTRIDQPDYTRGWSLWLDHAPARTAPYYGQTTDVTCGAVTALMMLEAEGVERFGLDGDANQAHEIDYWRKATNLPACDPVGLAVTTATEITAEALHRGKPRVVLSAEGFVLLEEYVDQPHEMRLREQLQQDSLRRAGELGIEIERRWIEVAEIRDLVADGNDVFLLIALEPLIGDPAPHWVLAHDVVDGCLIVSDPWVDQYHGESWVDTSNLPIPFAGIDLIMRWGSPEYRGAIIVSR